MKGDNWLSRKLENWVETTSEKVEINRSAYKVYSDMEKQFHREQSELNKKSIEIIKANLLIGGIIATLLSINPEEIAIMYFIVGSTTLLMSILFCVVAYSKTEYGIGESTENLEAMLDETSLEDHYRKLAQDYRDNLVDFKEKYNKDLNIFEIGLWTGFATIVLFIFGGIATVLSITTEIDYSVYLDGLLIFLVLLVVGVKVISLLLELCEYE